MKRLVITVLLGLVGVFALAGGIRAIQASEPGISPESLAQAIRAGQAPLVLDVRTPEEYAAGHIPGAVLIPHDHLAERLAELGGATEVVVYCHSGRRAGIAEDILIEAGIGVSQLEGSWLAWQAAGLPVDVPGRAAE